MLGVATQIDNAFSVIFVARDAPYCRADLNFGRPSCDGGIVFAVVPEKLLTSKICHRFVRALSNVQADPKRPLFPERHTLRAGLLAIAFELPGAALIIACDQVAISQGGDMTPEISEFSYGFALTNEIMAWAPLKIAPEFPSLIEEGKPGGGYDVELDLAGVPLYLQFKRGFRMTRRSAKEVRQYKKRLAIPFHRFHITDSGTSDQHTMLLELDDGKNDVFYAAPRFDRIVEINAAWAAKEVATRSIFVRPRDIGELDDELHHVAYDANWTFICSEPKAIEALSATQVVERLLGRLKDDPRPLREKISVLSSSADEAAKRGETRIRERRASKAGTMALSEAVDLFEGAPALPPPTRVPLRIPEPLSEPNRKLRELADKAYKTFDVQLVIVQPGSQ